MGTGTGQPHPPQRLDVGGRCRGVDGRLRRHMVDPMRDSGRAMAGEGAIGRIVHADGVGRRGFWKHRWR